MEFLEKRSLVVDVVGREVSGESFNFDTRILGSVVFYCIDFL